MQQIGEPLRNSKGGFDSRLDKRCIFIVETEELELT